LWQKERIAKDIGIAECKDGEYYVGNRILPVQPKKEGEFGVIERVKPPKDKWEKFFAKYDMSFDVGSKAVVVGNPREPVNMKHFISGGKKKTKATLDAGMMYITPMDELVTGKAFESYKRDGAVTKCITHEFPRKRQGFAAKVQLSDDVILVRSVLQSKPSFGLAFDLDKNKKTILLPGTKSARTGRSVIKKEGGVIGLVVAGQGISLFYRPKSLSFKSASQVIMNNGYICPGKAPLKCGKMFEDLTVMRNFNEWQVSSTGDLANIRGNLYLIGSTPDTKHEPMYSVQLEYLKKPNAQFNKAQAIIGRIEKMIVCAKQLNKRATASKGPKYQKYLGESMKATESTGSNAGEQCCVTKRACGLGVGDIHENGCTGAPPGLELSLKGY